MKRESTMSSGMPRRSIILKCIILSIILSLYSNQNLVVSPYRIVYNIHKGQSRVDEHTYAELARANVCLFIRRANATKDTSYPGKRSFRGSARNLRSDRKHLKQNRRT